MVFVAALGVTFNRVFRQPSDFRFGRREAFVLVTAAWVTASVVGSIPFIIYKGPGFVVDGLFESASGFTTTGASILTNVEAEPAGILLWRSLTHWLGGMGIIVLSVALLPALGRGAYQLYRAEAPGPSAERLRPRMKETAATLWSVYFILSLAETLLLMTGGMPLFDALCHTFGTMATGGFSTKTASIGAYGPYVQWVVIVFMVLAGSNFLLHYQALRGRLKAYWKSEEFRAYFALLAGSIAIFAVVLSIVAGRFGEDILRTASFQVVSIMTTTGYATADFNLWPAFLKITLILLMFVGGCAGSTGGGMKVIRVYVAVKAGFRTIVQAILPNAILPVKVDRRPVSNVYVIGAVAYFIIFVILFALGTVFLTVSEGTDIVTAFSAAVAALSNIGPGLGRVGAVENYAWISMPGKWMLSFLMLAGRLELYSILVLLVPATWRK